MKTNKFLLLVLMLIAHISYAQEPCGTNQYWETMLKANPELELLRQNVELQRLIKGDSNQFITNGTEKVAKVKIPVVFHILHVKDDKNLSNKIVLKFLL